MAYQSAYFANLMMISAQEVDSVDAKEANLVTLLDVFADSREVSAICGDRKWTVMGNRRSAVGVRSARTQQVVAISGSLNNGGVTRKENGGCRTRDHDVLVNGHLVLGANVQHSIVLPLCLRALDFDGAHEVASEWSDYNLQQVR